MTMPDTHHPIAPEQVEELIDFYLHWASHEFGPGWTLIDDTAFQTSRWLLEQLIARIGNQGLVGVDVELFDPSVACAVHPQYARLTVDPSVLEWGQWLGELHWHADGQLGGDFGPGLERLLVLVGLFGGAVRAFPTAPSGLPFEAVGWQVTDFVATALTDAATGTFLEERLQLVDPTVPHRDDRSPPSSGGYS